MATTHNQIMEVLEERIRSGHYGAARCLPTEFELAEEFGVSRGTIRRSLKTLRENGWVEQRRGVGSFIQCKLRQLAFVISHAAGGGEFELHFLKQIEYAAFKRGLDLAFANIDNNMDKALSLTRQWRAKGQVGVLFMPSIVEDYYSFNSRVLDLLEKQAIPYVVLDTPLARGGIIRGNFVGSDGYGAMRQLVRRLVDGGCQRFASLRTFQGVYSADQRLHGILDELAARGLGHRPESHVAVADVELARQGRREALQLLEQADYDVLMCSHDALAHNVIDELRRHGRRVPEDIAVTGFNDMLPETEGVTSVRQPFERMAERALEVLLSEDCTRTVRQEFLPCTLVMRPSTARAARALA